MSLSNRYWFVIVCLLINRNVGELVFDSLVDIDFRKFIHPCSKSPLHRLSHSDSSLHHSALSSNFNKKDAMERINCDDAGKLPQEVERFDSFSSYLHAHYWNETDYDSHNSHYVPPNSDVDMLWASPHPAPFALFDHSTKSTRLTWCDADETYLQDDFLLESLKNKKIVFYGDSIMRYQYLDLLYFMMYRKWSNDERLEYEVLHNGWPDYLLYTDNAFKHEELCECYRTIWGPGFTFNENRKYHNQELNTTIWFFLWFGDYSLPHGHFNVTEDVQHMDCMPNKCSQDASDHSWMAATAADFIFEFVSVHSPDIVLLNTGVHTALDGSNSYSRREMPLFTKHIQTLREKGHRTEFIFRSTTPHWEKPITDWRTRDHGALELAVRGIWKYFDASQLLLELFTVYVKVELASLYFNETGSRRGFHIDFHHYVPWINHEFNKLFIVHHLQNFKKV